jgi:uncharacterized membrane protein
MGNKLKHRDHPPSINVRKTQMALHVGPLPPAEELSRYGECVENGAERLFHLMEIQSAHRIELERTLVGRETSFALRGQVFGFLLGLLGLGGGLAAILAGHDWAGVAMSGASLVALVTAFLRGRANPGRDPAPPPSP